MSPSDLLSELSALEPEARIARLRAVVADLDLAERFELLHELGIYHHPESLSGAGSTLAETSALREALPRIFREHRVESLLDLPCGDFHWMRRVDLRGIDYVGADVVEAIVQRNERLHGGPGRRFLVLDGTADPLPRVDLVLCRDLLVHLAHDDVARLLANVAASGSRLLLASHFAAVGENREIVSGDFRPINLCRSPFGLPEPLEVVPERSRLDDGAYGDRSMALWSVDDVAPGIASRGEPPRPTG